MSLPTPAHTLARLAALEAAVSAWAEARRQHSRQKGGSLGDLRRAEKTLMQLAPTPPTVPVKARD